MTYRNLGLGLLGLATVMFAGESALAQTPAKKPNILVIMGDDVGWFNIGAYHRGMMSGKTLLSPPNDRTRSGISASCDELTG